MENKRFLVGGSDSTSRLYREKLAAIARVRKTMVNNTRKNKEEKIK
jgi:hypothetical protein